MMEGWYSPWEFVFVFGMLMLGGFVIGRGASILHDRSKGYIDPDEDNPWKFVIAGSIVCVAMFYQIGFRFGVW